MRNLAFNFENIELNFTNTDQGIRRAIAINGHQFECAIESDPRKQTYVRTHEKRINKNKRNEGSALVKAHSKPRLIPSRASDLSAWWLAYLRGETPTTEQTIGKLRVAELFCGPGGLAQGIKQFCREVGLEFSSVAAADIDEHAVAVYRANHDTPISMAKSGIDGDLSRIIHYDYQYDDNKPECTRFSSCELTDDTWAHLGEQGIDLLLAGPPCQGFSDFNNHTRFKDERNRHYLDVPAMAKALNCPTVIIENVPGVRSDKGGVVRIAELLFRSEGYNVATGVLKADDLGWPQTRARFFMIASKESLPIPINAIGEALSVSHPSEKLDLMWAIKDHEIAPQDDHMFRQADRSPDNLARIDYLFDHDIYDLPDSQRPPCHRDKAHTYPTVYGRLRPNEAAPTLTTGFMTNGRGRFTHPTQRRTLNPAEAARLQGFPDNYIFNPRGRPHNAELLKWIGDAVPMPLGYAAAMSALAPQLSDWKYECEDSEDRVL